MLPEERITPLFIPRAVRLPGDLRTLCQQYLEHLRVRNYARNTLAAYRRALEQCVGYLAGRDVTLVQCVTDAHLEGFARALADGEGNSPRTVAQKLEAVRGLFRYAVRQGLVPADNPGARIEAPRWHAEPPNAPPTAALLEMIESIDASDALGLRDRALFRLMLDGALRIDAVCSLDCYEPKAPPKYGVHPNGRVRYRAKGGATRESVVGEETVALVYAWQEARAHVRGASRTPALFISERGNRMNRQTVHARIKHWGARAGMPHLHAHLFRHARLREVMDHAGLAAAAALAGHKRQSTTADMYGERTAELLRHRVRQVPLGVKGAA